MFLDMLFGKRVTIFKRKDREAWERLRDALRAAGLRGVRANRYFADTLFACGCGSKLDPRNFGAKGRVDRNIYFIDVRERDLPRARAIIEERGLAADAVVEEDPIGELSRF